MEAELRPSNFETEQWIRAEAEAVFRFFADPGNLPRISPPGSGARIVEARLAPAIGPAEADPELAGAGSEIVISFRLLPYLPLRQTWTARIVEFEWGRYFRDVQVAGPFRLFEHTHSFQAEAREGRAGTVVRDSVIYDLGWGELLNATLVRAQLWAVFAYRQRATERLLAKA